MNEREPRGAFAIERPHQEHLHAAFEPRAMPVQPRRKHLRVVQYEAVSGPEKLRQIAKRPILPSAFAAMHH